ncbi:hypothetical protein, conserved [Babesia ovata]|uniref:6-Cys domain-containing protein n=1 Tax=Babesia ovata TaxID=189622 RepID=A0A2H6KCK1_9APIC|nr:uncharacterized protein BOVATA_022080 [Babesia ovata]GBE60715.1 hypothetical protein, conserved [Babesia ovata]
MRFDVPTNELVTITEHRLIFICGPKGLVLSDVLQHHLERLNSSQPPRLPWSPCTPLTEEISKTGKGLGLFSLYRGRGHLPLQGCGSRPSPLFATDEVTVDPVTGTRSCVADPMSKSPIGFVCEGSIEPDGCMRFLIDQKGEVVTAAAPRRYWDFNNYRPWVIARYFNDLALPPINGECRCIDPETERLKVRIEIRTKTDYLCDISSMIERNRTSPISGPWCSVVLHPGSTLTIRFPAEDVVTEHSHENSLPWRLPQKLPADAFKAEFLPKDLNTLKQSNAYKGFDIYEEVSYHEAIAGDALELDVLRMSQGEVMLKYNPDKPLALREGKNSFLYHWRLKSENEDVPDKVRATLKVSFAFTHKHEIFGCDSRQVKLFDKDISRRYCSTKRMGNGIGDTYECLYYNNAHVSQAGIYCKPDEELLPDNCDSTGYDLYSNQIMPFPESVRNVTLYPIRGFQVFEMRFLKIPVSYACICVDQRGYETSRLIVEVNDEVQHTYKVRSKERSHKLLPYVSIPWRKVGLLLEGSTSTRLIMLQHISKHSVRLQLGTKLLLRCEIAPELGNVANSANVMLTWLPRQLDEFHYTAVHVSLGRELIRTSHKDVMISTKGGLEAVFHEDLIRSGYQILEIRSLRGAILISKDPVHTQHVPMRFVCGKVPETSELSIVTANAPSSDASAQPSTRTTESSLRYSWTIVKVQVETTDPYMQGCGVTYSSDALFKPETPQLYDADGKPQFGCKIDLQDAREAAFYCPAPYLLNPPNCFNHVYVGGMLKNIRDISESLVASRSNHFVILSFDGSLVGPGETLHQTPPLECRCVTVKGIVLSTIQIENYYSK